ncbi:MAG: hypothetical protein KDA42_13075 [Planctomycetales bacterium]|nr:hypothetical protein [Planctomycetales bacterium]
MRVEQSTFYANGCAVRSEADDTPSHCKLSRCILAGESEARLIYAGRGGVVDTVETVEGTIGDPETDPQLLAPSSQWDKFDEAFNSRQFPRIGASF